MTSTDRTWRLHLPKRANVHPLYLSPICGTRADTSAGYFLKYTNDEEFVSCAKCLDKIAARNARKAV